MFTLDATPSSQVESQGLNEKSRLAALKRPHQRVVDSLTFRIAALIKSQQRQKLFDRDTVEPRKTIILKKWGRRIRTFDQVSVQMTSPTLLTPTTHA